MEVTKMFEHRDGPVRDVLLKVQIDCGGGGAGNGDWG